MISAIWKFIHESILNNIFFISLLLLGVVLLIVALSVGPKLLQKEKKTKRGAIEKKVDSAFEKVDNEIGESIVEDYEKNESEINVKPKRKSSIPNSKEMSTNEEREIKGEQLNGTAGEENMTSSSKEGSFESQEGKSESAEGKTESAEGKSENTTKKRRNRKK